MLQKNFKQGKYSVVRVSKKDNRNEKPTLWVSNYKTLENALSSNKEENYPAWHIIGFYKDGKYLM